jgi:hypothetical protein
VLQHAGHDFVIADYKAAMQINSVLTGCLGSIEQLLKMYQQLQKDTDEKLSDI